MTSDILGRDVVDDVRTACEQTGRPTVRAEVERALEPLSSAERDAVRRLARGGLATGPLGPEALVDISRGTPSEVAAARELGGYYALKSERDALARIAAYRSEQERAKEGAPSDRPPPGPPAERPPSGVAAGLRQGKAATVPPGSVADAGAVQPAGTASTAARPRARATSQVSEAPEEAEALMTLFAYHRDALRVAQELSLSVVELNDRIEALGLKRRLRRLLETTTDIDVFSPGRLRPARPSTPPTPVVRRRTEKPATPLPQAETEPEPTPPSMAEPAARTEPVNAFGTRVYRREQGKAEAPSGVPKLRREYVREPTRVPKPALPATKPEPPPAERRPFPELMEPQGRALLERLMAQEKANPRQLVAKLTEEYQGPGRELSESDLRELLEHHGLAHSFRGREVQNVRFLIGFHQGARGKLCNALQMSPEELASYLEEIGLAQELERTRVERARIELGRRRMPERLVQVLTRAPFLDDLGVLSVIDREVRQELEALFEEKESQGDSPRAVAEDVRAHLGLEPNPFAKLLRRYDMTSKLSEER